MIDLSNKPELRISNTDLQGSAVRQGYLYVIFEKPYKEGNICFCQMEFSRLFAKHDEYSLMKDINRFYENSLRIYNQFVK